MLDMKTHMNPTCTNCLDCEESKMTMDRATEHAGTCSRTHNPLFLIYLLLRTIVQKVARRAKLRVIGTAAPCKSFGYFFSHKHEKMRGDVKASM